MEVTVNFITRVLEPLTMIFAMKDVKKWHSKIKQVSKEIDFRKDISFQEIEETMNRYGFYEDNDHIFVSDDASILVEYKKERGWKTFLVMEG